MNKKETLEEVAEKIHPDHGYEDETYCDLGEMSRKLWLEGAKWQQERSYSEEEVMNILKKRDLHNCINMGGNRTWIDRPEWFEQFKKK